MKEPELFFDYMNSKNRIQSVVDEGRKYSDEEGIF